MAKPGSLMMGVHLNRGDVLTSPNGQFRLTLQVDGNLVLYKGASAPANAIWSSATHLLSDAQKPNFAKVQSDANFVLSVAEGQPVAWQAGTWGAFSHPWLWVQDDGNVVIYDGGQPFDENNPSVARPIWALGRYPDHVGAIPAQGHVDDTGAAIIHIPPTTKDIGNGHYIRTNVDMNASRSVAGHTELTCTNKIFGFTGGVQLIYRGINGQNFGVWPNAGEEGAPPWGINQAPFFSANHRDIDWFDSAPEGTHSIELIQFWAPRDRFPNILASVAQVAKEVEQGVTFIVKFGQEHPELVASVAAVVSLI